MPAPVLTSDDLRWNGFRLERYYISTDVPLTEKFYTSHLIGTALSGKLKNDFSGIGGGRTVSYRNGDSLLCPAELPHISYEPRQMDLLLIYLDPKFVERAARDLIVGENVELAPQLNFADCFVSDISKHLLREVEANGATGPLYAESLAIALAAGLVKNYSTARILPMPHKGGLAKRKLRLVVEFINENLSENLSLNMLAALCNLSVVHFAKAFKQSTGLAPHRFVNLRRIERAKNLLQKSNLTVTEIAVLTGFTDHSHLTKVFRRTVGVPPSVYQAQNRRN